MSSVDQRLIIITTNYDCHLEKSYILQKKSFTVLTHITNREHSNWGFIIVQRSTSPDEIYLVEPSKLVFSDFNNDTIIYKLHGTFGEAFTPKEDTIVITENDYADFIVMTDMKNFPPAFTRVLQEQHVLFLGYSLEDWNFRVILRKLQITRSPGQKYLWWAIQRNSSKIEERFWQKRNVELFNVDLKKFVEEMKSKL